MFKFSADDIANQSFQTKFRGYDPDQVHEFLQGLAREWRQVQEAVRRMQDEVDEQTRELRDYRRRERSLVEALEMARQVAEEIRHQADRDAELVLADTELKAERMLTRAEQKVGQLRSEMLDLHQQRVRFQSELKHMVESYASMIAHFEERAQGMEMLPPIPGHAPSPVAPRSDTASEERSLAEEVEDDAVVEDRPRRLTSPGMMAGSATNH
ncbi:hypothetical protein DL240_05235 [Lujinxingia litoralis]|uniref:Cell division protein DivIVA n=1 Tax=Lujinxingia litoralis TaxID=2211119 RepID=A0A328C6U7_9DELT|nr:DivIVA domain-containing protein [Lujinxingia litoralis]RAL23563.1 hypothetical protein DL240_05235 [Lujinxingia litoralis]